MTALNYNIADSRAVGTFTDGSWDEKIGAYLGGYTLVTIDYEINEILASNVSKLTWLIIGESADNFGCLLVKVGDAEYTEIWGIHGSVPALNKQAICLYSASSQAVEFELSHTFHCIGELAKTSRFPHKQDTFMLACLRWFVANRLSWLIVSDHTNDIVKHAAIVAYNHRWITRYALIEHYGIDRDSAWLER